MKLTTYKQTKRSKVAKRSNLYKENLNQLRYKVISLGVHILNPQVGAVYDDNKTI